jgi:ubiquinone/menaquinone biosynthesis C-methylase UbiE
MQSAPHWENIYSTKAIHDVSWFQKHARCSLDLIGRTQISPDARIIDVGSGASILISELIAGGYKNLTVLDISSAAIAAAQKQLGSAASGVQWIHCDVTKVKLSNHSYDLWHDRAAFHFLTEEHDRAAYIKSVSDAVKPGGHLILATFAEDGPLKCSGLQIVRYSPQDLRAQFEGAFSFVEHQYEEHATPFGTIQRFVYCHFQRRTASNADLR